MGVSGIRKSYKLVLPTQNLCGYASNYSPMFHCNRINDLGKYKRQ